MPAKKKTPAKKVVEQKSPEPDPVVEAPKPKKDPKKTLEIAQKAKQLRTYLGDASQEYLLHVSAYREYLPEEYTQAKHNIEIWL